MPTDRAAPVDNCLIAMTTTERRSVAFSLKWLAPRFRVRREGHPQDTRRAAQHPTPSSSPVHRCREHIAALYLLAYLCTGQRDAAEELTVDAIATAATHRAIMIAGAPWVWQILAEQIHYRASQYPSRDEAGDGLVLDLAGLSPPQREAFALVAAGRKVREAAMLLGVTTTQIHRELGSALQGLGIALRAAEPGRPDRGGVADTDSLTI